MKWYSAIIISVLVILFAGTAKAQVSETEARRTAVVVIEGATQLDQVRFTRRCGDLEDQFRLLWWLQYSGDQKAPNVFIIEVSDEGYDFRKGKIDHDLSVHGPFVYYVAISAVSGEAFRISGFPNSQDELNRMAKAFRFGIRADSALGYIDLYLKIDPRHYEIKRPTSVFEMKQLAEYMFYKAYGFDSGENAFNDWWKTKGSFLSRQSYKPVTTETPLGFTVTFLTVSGISPKHSGRGPGPFKVSLDISREGQISGPTFEPVGQQ